MKLPRWIRRLQPKIWWVRQFRGRRWRVKVYVDRRRKHWFLVEGFDPATEESHEWLLDRWDVVAWRRTLDSIQDWMDHNPAGSCR